MRLKFNAVVFLISAFILLSANVIAQNNTGTIKGKVSTLDGKAAADVSVTIKGTNKGSITDVKGEFIINKVQTGNAVVQISLQGFNAIEENVVVEKNQTSIASFELKVNDKELQEVIITSGRNKFVKKESDDVGKMPLKNLENSQVYTTITKELMKEQLVFSVDDAMKNATGITKMWEATGRSGDGGSYYNSRGFIVQSQLRNGVAGNVSTKIDAANLERIEVIKGPSATLFGSTLTSYGGLINRITKKPYDSFGGEVAYSAGSFGFNRISADINTPLDSAKNVLLRLNTAYNYDGSYLDNGYNKNFSFAPSLSYKVNDKLSFLLEAELYNGRNIVPPTYFFPYGQTVASMGVSRANQLSLDYNRAFTSGDVSQQSRNTNFFGQMTYKFNSQWSTQTNFTNTNSYSDGTGAYFYLLSNAAATGNASAIGSDYISRNDQATQNSTKRAIEIQQNINGDYKIGRMRNRFVGGLDYSYVRDNEFFTGVTTDTIASHGTIPTYRNFNPNTLQALYNAGKASYIYPVNTTTNTYSAYASDLLNLTDNLMVSAALRVDYFNNLGTYDITSGLTSGGFHQAALSPKFGIVYQPIKDVISLFANYQNSFTNETGNDYAGKAFKPEHANQMEGGIKLDAFGGKFTGTISYYNIKVTDVVRTYPVNPLFSIQDGTQISQGLEAEIIATPFQGMNVVAGFSYNDSKYQKADADVVGRRPSTASAPYAGNLWLSYHISKGGARGLGFGFGGNYASDNVIINSVSQGVFTLPAFAILNASIFYDQQKFRIGIKVDNLNNQKYWIGYTTVDPQQLRSFAGSIAFKF